MFHIDASSRLPPPTPTPPLLFFLFSFFISKVPEPLDVNENGGGCKFKPALSATDDRGSQGGATGKPSGQSCPSTTVYRRKEKIEIDLWRWDRGWVRRGRGFSCHSFSHSKCQLIRIGAPAGVSLR